MTTTLVMSRRCPLVIRGHLVTTTLVPLIGEDMAKKRQTVTSGRFARWRERRRQREKSVAATSSVVRSPHAPQPKSGSRGRVVVLGVDERQLPRLVVPVVC